MEVERTRQVQSATQPEPAQLTEEARNKARLAAAARLLIPEAVRLDQNFGWAAAQLMGEPGGDAAIAGMIEFSIRLREAAREIVDSGIEADSGMSVDIETPGMEYLGPIRGRLVSLEGTSGLPTGRGILEGTAILTTTRTEVFIPVRILEDGTVYSYDIPGRDLNDSGRRVRYRPTPQK